MYIKYFSRLDRSSKYWHLLVLIPFMFLENRLSVKNASRIFKSFFREFKAIKLPTDNRFSGAKLPEIEILCVAAGKDLPLIPLVIDQAIKSSGNHVNQVTIVTRAMDLPELNEILDGSGLTNEIKVVNEETLVSQAIREKLSKNFGSRYGWVLQQFLALSFILNSKSRGVLLVNADTVILRKCDWLDENSRQILMVSTEFHPPYYEFLNKLIGSPIDPQATFITHHMLFQPQLLREIFSNFEINGLELLVDTVVQNADLSSISPVCVEFELYGQGILLLHPELIEFRKFANSTWSRSERNLEIVLSATKGNYPKWNSISLHDYA